MKKYILYTFCYFMGIGILYSCDDILDAFPQDQISGDKFWNTDSDAEKLLVDIYSSTIPSSGIFWDECMSDNAYLAYDWWGGEQQVANGSSTVYGDKPSTVWSSAYSSIRKCWFLLEGLDKIPFESESDKGKIKGETYFMLAYNYYLLTTYFGDVPLVTRTLNIQESKEVVRESKQVVVEYALDKLNEAMNLLNGVTSEYGRVTADACCFLKARIQLFNEDYTGCLETLKNLDGKYQLYSAGDTPYEDLFSGAAENNCEVILARICDVKQGSISIGHSGNGAMLLKGMTGGDPYAGIFPTGSLVDAYPMADGRLIHESGSSYDPKNPYLNRDPRFYQSITYPTSQIKYLDGTTNTIKECLYDPEDPTTIAVQQYSAPEPSRTGYVWNKYIDYSSYAMLEIWDCTNDIIVFRYADALLMKAEALFKTQGVGAKSDICDLIDQLRDRCRGGRVHRENYNTEDELFSLIKNERRIELANEGGRYQDLIRWKDAEKNSVETGIGLSGELYGAYMRLDGVGKNDRTVLVDGVPRRYVETRYFNTSNGYLFPIPQKDRDLNSNLTQNPNW